MTIVDGILSALRTAPNGLTTAEIVAQVGRFAPSVSGKLSQLADYGRIVRKFEHTDEGQRIARWSLQ